MNNPLFDFLNASPTPYHAVDSMTKMLEAEGYTALSESEAWKVKAGGKYFTTRNGSSLVAFYMGEDVEANGFRMVGAHTDSPCLRLRPNSELIDRNFTRLAVEVYGGVLLSTWFDRDLSIAGTVFYGTKSGAQRRLVNFVKPVAVVPNLAIHLNRTANENRTIQKQQELPALFSQGASKENPLEAALLDLLAKDGVKDAQSILSHDLCLYNTQGAAAVGLHGEFLSSSRLDNLLSCFVGVQALLKASGKSTSVFVASDHEEVGSASAVGAQGPFLKSVLERLTGSNEGLTRAISRSVLVSTDNAHGIHPNYPEKHDSNHAPILNQGPVIKTNTNQRYATSAETAALFRECCQQADVPVQEFVSRNDMGCGSTIGPITASVLGVKTIDVGLPTFAMHSIRELAGSRDAELLCAALINLYNHPGWD